MTDELGLHHIVTGLLRRRGRCLLVHRHPGRQVYPDRWDLPGGHVEPGESGAAALSRELFEELGVGVDVVGEPFAHVRGEEFRMDVWVVDEWVGEPAIVDQVEHDALAWLDHREVGGLRLADPRLAALMEAALS